MHGFISVPMHNPGLTEFNVRFTAYFQENCIFELKYYDYEYGLKTYIP